MLRERVKNPLLEEYKIRSSEKETDLLNFTNQELSPEELIEIADALNAIATYTGGKIFDRVPGIVLASSDSFQEGAAGSFSPYFPAVMVNMDAMRNPPDDSYSAFTVSRFPGRKVTILQFILAHEYGHSMDLNYITEVEAHGINKDEANPDWMGYGNKTGSFCAFKHSLQPASDERGLSRRAREGGPEEDFAESFAIASLGGEVRLMPDRYIKLAKTIKLAEGEQFIGPHKVEIKKVESLELAQAA